jgi:ADP-ribosyl-[dinitrogen reductase] hydrolase
LVIFKIIMFDPILKEKFFAAIWGFIVGDALGVPYEFLDRNTMTKNPAIGMIGYGSHNQPAGTWSDDSSMMICVLENMKNGGTVKDLSKLFLNWYYKGYQTANGEAFDIGYTTLASLIRLREGVSLSKAGSSDEWSAGNGSLMRCVPYAFAQDLHKSIFDMIIHNNLTHKLSICNEACMLFVKMIRSLAEGYTKEQALSTAVAYLRFGWRISDDMEVNPNKEKFSRLFDSSFVSTHIDDIYSDGYVIHTLEAAIWCFMNNESYHDAVLQAVNCGGDTDTIAALTGALSATFYGLDNIPSDWKRKIRRHDELDEILREYI